MTEMGHSWRHRTTPPVIKDILRRASIVDRNTALQADTVKHFGPGNRRSHAVAPLAAAAVIERHDPRLDHLRAIWVRNACRSGQAAAFRTRSAS